MEVICQAASWENLEYQLPKGEDGKSIYHPSSEVAENCSEERRQQGSVAVRGRLGSG